MIPPGSIKLRPLSQPQKPRLYSLLILRVMDDSQPVAACSQRLRRPTLAHRWAKQRGGERTGFNHRCLIDVCETSAAKMMRCVLD